MKTRKINTESYKPTTRDELGKKLLQSVQEMKAEMAARTTQFAADETTVERNQNTEVIANTWASNPPC